MSLLHGYGLFCCALATTITARKFQTQPSVFRQRVRNDHAANDAPQRMQFVGHSWWKHVTLADVVDVVDVVASDALPAVAIEPHSESHGIA